MKPPASPSLRLRLFSSVAVASALALSAFGSSDTDHLLPDGSFEKPDSTGEWPIDWPKSRNKNVSWESEAGNWFIRITAAESGVITSLYRKISVPPNVSAVELSFRRRITGLVVGEQPWFDARVMLNFVNATGKKTAPSQVPYAQRDTLGWETVVHTLRVPEGTVAIEFMPALFRVTTGTFDIDDVVLKVADPRSVP